MGASGERNRERETGRSDGDQTSGGDERKSDAEERLLDFSSWLQSCIRKTKQSDSRTQNGVWTS